MSCLSDLIHMAIGLHLPHRMKSDPSRGSSHTTSAIFIDSVTLLQPPEACSGAIIEPDSELAVTVVFELEQKALPSSCGNVSAFKPTYFSGSSENLIAQFLPETALSGTS
ncbi:hypothetical protein E1B28_001601 [Marasmius oreades]|uniref:Uncharacterized protein n=1 Tax=Marasmius oreades TaxID=181124 RepID=A0A9P7V3R1_9AGAR|nr:uncharacterized protein E1B28_001601 [Marasmius oreades]KAG7099789.1 hypothetical protein E1B28_001601 [Marasmius oreades]